MVKFRPETTYYETGLDETAAPVGFETRKLTLLTTVIMMLAAQ